MRWTVMQPTEIDAEAIDDATKAALLEAMKASVMLVVNDAKRSVARGPKTGRIYLRGKNRNIRHQASAPGEPPATDTGRLVSSIRGDAAINRGHVEGYVEAKTSYAAWLEFGTRRMAARPFMVPAVEKNRARILQIMRAAVVNKASGFKRK